MGHAAGGVAGVRRVVGQQVMADKVTLKSSHLLSATYDAENKTLDIEFKSGLTYRYIGVPALVYNGLITASSPGQYFHSAVKRYPAELLRERKP